MVIGRTGTKIVFRCCKCGKSSNGTDKNTVKVGTPPGTKYFCKECSGTGKAGVYKV